MAPDETADTDERDDTDELRAERERYDETEYDPSTMRRATTVVERRVGPRSTFALRLEGETIEEVRRLAEQRGLGPTQLVRQWVLERLAAERGGGAEPFMEAVIAAARSVAREEAERVLSAPSRRAPARKAAKKAAAG